MGWVRYLYGWVRYLYGSKQQFIARQGKKDTEDIIFDEEGVEGGLRWSLISFFLSVNSRESSLDSEV